MTVIQLKEQVRSSIKKFRTKEAMELISTWADSFSDEKLKVEITILQANWASLSQDKMLYGQDDSINIRQARLNYSILILLDVIEEPAANVDLAKPTFKIDSSSTINNDVIELTNSDSGKPLQNPVKNSNSSPDEIKKGFMKSINYVGISIILLVIIGLCIAYLKGGTVEISQNGAKYSSEKTAPIKESDTPIILRAAMSGTIIYDGKYLTKDKVSRIYFEHDSNNETSDISDGKFFLNSVIVPDTKIIKLIVDFKDGKQGESKIIDLNTCSKTGSISYGLGRISIPKVSNASHSSSSTEINSKPSSRNLSSPRNPNITVIVNPHMEQNVNQQKVDTSKK